MLTQIPPDTGLETAAGERRTLAVERAAGRSGVLDFDVVAAVRRARLARHFVARELGCSAGPSAAPARAVLAVGEGRAATAWCASPEANGTGGFSQGRPAERFRRDITAATSPFAPQYDTAARKNYSAVLIGPES
ncbi:hypothetical protein ACFYSH_26810 [Streptomyces sp. NPDC005791]|uniref:hypothetical protein n=1 Tax=unclassified Streptomyces TaxID=2593676 RepID=UPI003411AF0F